MGDITASVDTRQTQNSVSVLNNLKQKAHENFGQLLPKLDCNSEILDLSLISKLETNLGESFQGYDWSLVFTSNDKNKQGIEDFYKSTATIDIDATLILIKDMGGSKFGAFTNSRWEISPTYFGTSESFLFTLEPDFNIYRASNKNNYFMLCNDDSIAMGGGGDFAIFLDGDFNTGTSGPCETFNNPKLASEEDLIIKVVEVWTFKVREN